MQRLIGRSLIGLLIGLVMLRTRMTLVGVIGRLRSHLRKGAYGPQDKLEPERILAPMIGCSRATLRAALDVLEREGLIWRHVGQGTFVGPRPAGRPIRPGVLVEMASPEDVLEARLVIEPRIASAAAACAHAQDVAAVRAHALKTSEALDWQSYEQADDAFHKSIAHLTRNPLLIGFVNMLSSVRGRARWQREHDLAFRRAHKEEYATQQGKMHLAIVDALASRDPAGAEQAMLDHLIEIRKIMIADVD